MKRKLLASLTATIMFLALVLTGCPQAIDPDKEVTQKPGTTSQKIDAVKTTGEMGKPETAADGTITLTTTDSTGGKYTFKQMGGGGSSIRAASPTRTWDYTNSKNIKQFEGTFNGDIAKEGANDLNLTVEKAADANGTLQEVTEPQSFNFEVSASGTFAATIPAVEIVVQKEQTSDTPKLIKTVIYADEYDNSDSFYIEKGTQTFEFYSDKTFRINQHIIWTGKDPTVDFSYEEKGIAYTGTYTGDPTKDGMIICNIQKMSKKMYATDENTLYQAYKNGTKFVSYTSTEADLVSMTCSTPLLISGSECSFPDTDDFDVSYVKNTDNSTSLQVNISGDDAERFGLRYVVLHEGTGGPLSQEDGTFNTPIPVTVTQDTKVEFELYVGAESNLHSARFNDTILLKSGYNAIFETKVKRIDVPFKVEGNQSQYTDIKVDGNGCSLPADLSSSTIIFYCLNNYDVTSYNIRALDFSAGYGNTISDSVDIILDKDNPPTTPVTIKLWDKLTEGNKITVTGYDDTTTGEKNKFRFERGTDGNIVFYVPIGTGTDGDFLRYGHIQELFEATYFPIDHLDAQANTNYTYQFAGLVDNMKDVIWYLETKKGLTVEGKDLIGL